ncbi:MAG: Eco57I restriction-modification methylase domain-containing protein [bacterium]|nr:Eco57I restriction-modification methylase domain-containing protein [bacterium]
MPKQILQDIINDFSLKKFNNFFREKSDKYGDLDEKLSKYDKDIFSNSTRLGVIDFGGHTKDVAVVAVQVAKDLTERSSKKAQYDFAKNLLKQEDKYEAGIFIFYDLVGNFRFSLIYPQYRGTKRIWNNFRRFTYFVNKEFNNKTFLLQIGDGKFEKIDDIKESFSLSKVSDEFYKQFNPIFEKLCEQIYTENTTKGIDGREAKDFGLLFVIRTIFIGFIQKRKWIGDDEKFLQTFISEYLNNPSKKENHLYDRWLRPLFFEALNSPPGRKVAYQNNDFSAVMESKLQMAPYLNGGLFDENDKEIDRKGYTIPDKVIIDFFDFLFSYNFTIEENTLYDEELELNPEFLGIIFERLVNKEDGAVYTPRTEVDFMCRLSLIKWLAKNNTTDIEKRDLYELFFIEGGKDKDHDDEQKTGSFSEKQYKELLELLGNISVCDPAVGSGAFPVGMLHVLEEILQHIKIHLKEKEISTFETKKGIIEHSLYGVEIKSWAVWITQLRLWITLFIDAPESMKNSLEPILPSLDFKIRCGDSLVQMVGNKMFPIQGHANLLQSIKVKITQLKNLKTDYYYNKIEKHRKQEIRLKESALYTDILETEILEKKNKLKLLKNIKQSEQKSIFGENDYQKNEQACLMLNKNEIESLEVEINELEEQKKSLRKDKPLVWAIEFSEIFVEHGGFDIVIGNPPYVRQEAIEDPTGKIKNKKEYKNHLEEMVKLDFPNDFAAKTKINAQSDLYTYFYIRGLRLLNPQGIHTFICSNSWLDVGYGVWLQDFLLKRAPVELIIDNHAKRSFGAADVNTIISIISAPQKKVDDNSLIKFVAFKKPFEEAVFTENLLAIENAEKVESNDVFRVYPIANKDLREAGMEYDNEEQKTLGGKYSGDKWGGKYLRAPNIFFTILEKGKDKLVKLGDIAENIKRNNLENFKKWLITKNRFIDQNNQFPFLHSLKDIKSIQVKLNELRSFDKTTANKDTKYIKPDIISNRFVGERMFFIEGGNFLVNDSFFIANLKKDIDKNSTVLLLNSTLSLLLLEVMGRKTFAVGVMYIYGPEFRNCLLLNPKITDKKQIEDVYEQFVSRPIKSIFEECGIDPKSDVPIEEQEPKPLSDRTELDKIVFDALCLTENERKEVYRAVCRLVWNRISKAKSV